MSQWRLRPSLQIGASRTLDSVVPEGLRVGYRILKNAGCLPPELLLRNEISEVESLLNQAETSDLAFGLRRRMQLLKTQKEFLSI